MYKEKKSNGAGAIRWSLLVIYGNLGGVPVDHKLTGKIFNDKKLPESEITTVEEFTTCKASIYYFSDFTIIINKAIFLKQKL